MSDQNNNRSGRDSRKERFFREARAIIHAQGQWNDETRLKLRLLAERLRLPDEEFENALQELTSADGSERRGRWEEAYIAYLEKQFDKYPGNILTIKAERKAIQYGEKRFQLSVDVCDRLIEHVAERMEMVRISEPEALRHAKSEVVRLATGHYDSAEELLEQVVQAVADWGVDPERARQLLSLQLMANRRKRRKRWARSIILRSMMLICGLGSIAATWFLGQMIVQWEQHPENKVTNPSAVDLPKNENQVVPDWWTAEMLPLLERLDDSEWSDLKSDLLSKSPSDRRAANLKLVSTLWGSETGGDGFEFDLEDADLQSYLLQAAENEPASENVASLVDQWQQMANLPLSIDRPLNLNQAMILFDAQSKLNRIRLRLLQRAEADVERRPRWQAIFAVDSDLSRALNEGTEPEELRTAWLQKQLAELTALAKGYWLKPQSAPPEKLSVEIVQQTVEGRNELASEVFAFYCALLGMMSDSDSTSRDEIWQALERTAGPGVSAIPLLEWMMLDASTMEREHAVRLLRVCYPEVVLAEADVDESGVSEALAITDQLGLTIPVTDLQKRLRAQFLLDHVLLTSAREAKSQEEWLIGFQRTLLFNSMAICLLEADWDFHNFNKLVRIGDDMREPKGEVDLVDDQLVFQLSDQKDGLRYQASWQQLLDALATGQALTAAQGQELVCLGMGLNDDARTSALRNGMPNLLRQPAFLVALADASTTAAGEELLSRISQWGEIQVRIADWDRPSLKAMALRLLLEESVSAQEQAIGIAMAQHLSVRAAALDGIEWEPESLTSRDLSGLFTDWLSRLNQSDVELVPLPDARIENMLLLQHAMLQLVGDYYQVDPTVALTDFEADWWNLESLYCNEAALAKLLRTKLETEYSLPGQPSIVSAEDAHENR